MKSVNRALVALLLSALPPPGQAEPRVATLDVKGMTCATCPLTVRQVLLRTRGVSAATVDFKGAFARVALDDAVVDVERLVRALSESGFPAAPRDSRP